jgi:hypothetical protein
MRPQRPRPQRPRPLRPLLLAAALAGAAPLLLACGPNPEGSWALALWEVEGADTSTSRSDAGWLDMHDDPDEPFRALMRYSWSEPALDFVPFEVPYVTYQNIDVGAAEEEWEIVGYFFDEDNQQVFTLTDWSDDTLIFEEPDYPNGRLSRWTLTRF